jgi:hypothetical protein
MKYAHWTRGRGTRAGGALGYARGATLAIVTAAALSGCAGRWFDVRPQQQQGQEQAHIAQAPSHATSDLQGSLVTYIQGLCTLPRDQRDPQVRVLNQALLPNHATISCGRAGDSL